jgi:hypothetical protein
MVYIIHLEVPPLFKLSFLISIFGKGWRYSPPLFVLFWLVSTNCYHTSSVWIAEWNSSLSVVAVLCTRSAAVAWAKSNVFIVAGRAVSECLTVFNVPPQSRETEPLIAVLYTHFVWWVQGQYLEQKANKKRACLYAFWRVNQTAC